MRIAIACLLAGTNDANISQFVDDSTIGRLCWFTVQSHRLPESASAIVLGLEGGSLTADSPDQFELFVELEQVVLGVVSVEGTSQFDKSGVLFGVVDGELGGSVLGIVVEGEHHAEDSLSDALVFADADTWRGNLAHDQVGAGGHIVAEANAHPSLILHFEVDHDLIRCSVVPECEFVALGAWSIAHSVALGARCRGSNPVAE